MNPQHMQLIREHMGLGRRDFARLLGYSGSDAQNWWAIARMEKGVEKNGRPISPMCARLVLLVYREWLATGKLVDFDELASLAKLMSRAGLETACFE